MKRIFLLSQSTVVFVIVSMLASILFPQASFAATLTATFVPDLDGWKSFKVGYQGFWADGYNSFGAPITSGETYKQIDENPCATSLYLDDYIFPRVSTTSNQGSIAQAYKMQIYSFIQVGSEIQSIKITPCAHHRNRPGQADNGLTPTFKVFYRYSGGGTIFPVKAYSQSYQLSSSTQAVSADLAPAVFNDLHLQRNIGTVLEIGIETDDVYQSEQIALSGLRAEITWSE